MPNKQEECKSQLPSIISAQRLRECQGFVDKVDEIRFTKVKQRQLNKYNILLNKKEGNITRANATTNPSNLASQAGRQVLSFPLGKEAIYLRQAGTLLPPREGSSICQAIAHLPPREGSNSPLATAHHPTGEGSNSPLATAHLPPREGSRSPRLLLIFPPDKQAVLPRQLLTSALGKVTVLPSQPPFLPRGREVVILRQANMLGQVGRASGILPGIGHPRLPRRIAVPPGRQH